MFGLKGLSFRYDDRRDQWQCVKIVRQSGKPQRKVIYIPDPQVPLAPRSADEQWLCEEAPEPCFTSKDGNFSLIQVTLVERLAAGPLDLAFVWKKRMIPGDFQYQWEAEIKEEGRTVLYVLDRRVAKDARALKPKAETGDIFFRCRITRVIVCSAERRIFAVRPVEWLPAPDAIPAQRAVEALRVTFDDPNPPRRKPRLVAVG